MMEGILDTPREHSTVFHRGLDNPRPSNSEPSLSFKSHIECDSQGAQQFLDQRKEETVLYNSARTGSENPKQNGTETEKNTYRCLENIEITYVAILCSACSSPSHHASHCTVWQGSRQGELGIYQPLKASNQYIT